NQKIGGSGSETGFRSGIGQPRRKPQSDGRSRRSLRNESDLGPDEEIIKAARRVRSSFVECRQRSCRVERGDGEAASQAAIDLDFGDGADANAQAKSAH